MSSAYLPSTRRRGIGGYVASIDDFMNWLLYGEETWLVADLPVPVRILRRKDGQDEMDLRLKALP